MIDPAISINGLALTRGARPVLAGVDLQVARGEVVTLMGASGSGKTTILRVLAGLEPFQAGAVAVEGVTLPAGPPVADRVRALREKLGMVFQFHCLFEHLPAIENVALALVHVRRVRHDEARRVALDLLGSLGVDRRAHALPRELSGGEAQRVAIARALATDPPVLLMDEPTASLDPARRAELAALVNRLAARPRALLIATHDEDFASQTQSRIVRLHEGRVVEPATSASVRG
jgi:ABC-type polar amino acid transport system ATPase subunit